MKRKVLLLTICLLIAHIMGVKAQTGTTFTAKTIENWDMVFTILDESEKTCQVGYIDGDGSVDKMAVDKDKEGSLTIPETVNGYTVVKIGKHALQINGMTSVMIPNTVTAIDEYAFYGCYRLTSFELPASVVNIGDCALSSLSNVTSFEVENGNTKYDSRGNCNAIIETATDKLLFGCIATTIPASVKEIGDRAFDGLKNLTLTIPATVTNINDYAFRMGFHLTLRVEHTIPLEIDENVFEDLNSSILQVPVGYKTVYAESTGWSKFSNILEGNEGSTFTAKTAEGIDMVFTVLDEDAKTCQVGYLEGSPDYLAIDKESVEGSLTIPGKANDYTVVKIGKWALFHIDGMTSVTIPNTVTAIDNNAFAECYSLTAFELPTSVTYLGNDAFSGCSGLTSVTIPNSVTSIGEYNQEIEGETNVEIIPVSA